MPDEGDDPIWIDKPPILRFEPEATELVIRGRRHEWTFRMSHKSGRAFVIHGGSVLLEHDAAERAKVLQFRRGRDRGKH